MILGFTYYTYQQLGKHRGFVDDNVDRKNDPYPKRRRRNKSNNQKNKGRRRGLLYNNRENDLHEGVQNKKFDRNDTPWMDHFEKIIAEGNNFLSATVFSPQSKYPRKKSVMKDEASVADSHTQSSRSPDLYSLKRVDPRSLIRSKAEMSEDRGEEIDEKRGKKPIFLGKGKGGEEVDKRRGKSSIFLSKGRGRTPKTGKSSVDQDGKRTAMFMGAQRVRSNFKYEPPKMTKLPDKKKKVVVQRNDDKTTLVKVDNNYESPPVYRAQDHFAAATYDYQANSTQERPHFDEGPTVKPDISQSDRNEMYHNEIHDNEIHDNEMYYSEMHDDQTRDGKHDDDMDHDDVHDLLTNYEVQDDVYDSFTEENKLPSQVCKSVSNYPDTTIEERRSPKNDERQGNSIRTDNIEFAKTNLTSSGNNSNVRGVYGLKRSHMKKRTKNADITWSKSSAPKTQTNPPPSNTEVQQNTGNKSQQPAVETDDRQRSIPPRNELEKVTSMKNDRKEFEMATTRAKKKNKALKGSSALAAKVLERHRNRYQAKKNVNKSNAPDTVPAETNHGKLLDEEINSESSDDDSNGPVHEYVDDYGEISFVFSA